MNSMADTRSAGAGVALGLRTGVGVSFPVSAKELKDG
jgi:hypothetical protein